ncbi:hypothetical protein PIB30_002714 [Stylosanthes scabra]|uniref:Retrotransposon Copia-like N-terminal domain-containing protein n=1 Tax=Stylosanthes scabra TaxID=79078 RepID=A0ABU6R254_9FABA|nr:hypothetical protein [Stylosanthes scabra]
MALLLTDSTNTYKSGLVPLTDKLDDKNFNTWKFQAWLTIQTLELENHLDPTKTSSPTDSFALDSEADSAVQNPPTDGATPTSPPTAGVKNDKGAAYRVEDKEDVALVAFNEEKETHGRTIGPFARFVVEEVTQLTTATIGLTRDMHQLPTIRIPLPRFRLLTPHHHHHRQASINQGHT